MLVWTWSLPPVEIVHIWVNPTHLGLPWENLLLWGSLASPPLCSPSRNSGISSSPCAKLLLSRRARCLPAPSALSAGGPCVPRNSASWASWCVPPASPAEPHHMVAPSDGSPKPGVPADANGPPCSTSCLPRALLWSCWGSKANTMGVCLKNKAAAAKLLPLCPPRTTATQQRISAVPHQDSLPWITWCISLGTPLMPTAG